MNFPFLTTKLVFTIRQVEVPYVGTGRQPVAFDVIFSRGSREAVFLPAIRSWHTINQMILEGVRRLSRSEPSARISVVDPTGNYERWISKLRRSSGSIPDHEVLTVREPEKV